MTMAQELAKDGFDYWSVTETSGDEVSQEQIHRMCQRYFWAASYCGGKDVLELACGTGQGLGVLAAKARSLQAGDISDRMVETVRKHYGSRVSVSTINAESLPMKDQSLDVILLFEAIYYLPNAQKFVRECKRALRPGGKVLIATANKDLFDFHASPHSFVYYGVAELEALFGNEGFSVVCYGNSPVAEVSMVQKILRPIKKVASSLNLIPKTMAMKKLLKRVVFGALVPLPAEITPDMAVEVTLSKVTPGVADRGHKVIFCEASLPVVH